MSKERTPYEVLGLCKRATLAEIDAAWARALREAKSDEQAQAEVNAAHDQLIDPEKRAKVDVLAFNYPLSQAVVPPALVGICWPRATPRALWVTASEMLMEQPPDAAQTDQTDPKELEALGDELRAWVKTQIDPWEDQAQR